MLARIKVRLSAWKPGFITTKSQAGPFFVVTGPMALINALRSPSIVVKKKLSIFNFPYSRCICEKIKNRVVKYWNSYSLTVCNTHSHFVLKNFKEP